MTLLVSYDIEDDRLRLKAANKLLETGFIRLQLSVYAGTPSEAAWRQCLLWLQQEVTAGFGAGDNLFYLPLTEGQSKNFVFLPTAPDDWNELLQAPSTLFV
jgi:CRISPR-associated endonuclease Cas2